MTASSVSVEGEVVFYSYRGNGGKPGKRELPRPAFEAILTGACTSSGTRRRSCIVTPGRRSKTCRGSSTTPAWGSDDNLPQAARGAGGPELGKDGRGRSGSNL